MLFRGSGDPQLVAIVVFFGCIVNLCASKVSSRVMSVLNGKNIVCAHDMIVGKVKLTFKDNITALYKNRLGSAPRAGSQSMVEVNVPEMYKKMYKRCTRKMYKRCTRNVQEMYKNCTRDVQEIHKRCTRNT